MENLNNLYCLILAGGKGRRLWPESRPSMPKQFIDFFGTGRTQLQLTWERYRKILPANHILISTSLIYRDLVMEQIPECVESNILAEPIWRNTAPCIAWGTHRILVYNKDASIIVAPSDHLVIGEDKFHEDVVKGYDFVSQNDSVLVFGVRPTRPESGYGYIQMDEEKAENIYHTRSFIEKPEPDFARMFMENGEFLWNTGMVMAKAVNLMERFHKLRPPVVKIPAAEAQGFNIEKENNYIGEHFPSYPNISLEQGILEKAENVDVMCCRFGWTDLGTWQSIYEAEHKVSGENVVLDSEVITENSHDNIIKLPKGHLAVINGLSGYIISEKDNILLICPRENSASLIRKYSTEVELARQEE